MNKKIALILAGLVMPVMAWASGTSVHLDHANINLKDKASLQHGAQLYMNYCSGCHATGFQRYNRVAVDLGIKEELMQTNLMFVKDAKIGDLMNNNMTASDGKKWFGQTPPDLTLVARVRGVDWLYTYLRGFYKDDSRPFGVNNTVFPEVGMPHVLQELQGVQVKTEDGELELVKAGKLSEEAYDESVRDLVNFLAYSGEPVRLEREAIGVKVLIFLVVFFFLAYLLKKEYWKDVH
ncbi:MAG: cytochrome c1 [Gammaproteobacteria bacterium]|nr:cytochrome c1 [Gammaproteobacteria bacterium]